MGSERGAYDLQLENSELTAQTLECQRLEAALQAEIIERKRLEAALCKSEQRFQRLADTGLIGIFTTNSQMTILEANTAFLGMVGYSRDELLALEIRWDRLTPPELLQRDLREKAESQRTGVVLPYEKELVHKDGRRIPVLIGGAHLDSTADEAICIVLDMTGQKHAEEVKRAQAIAEAEIAERQRVEAELYKSKRRFKRLADAGILGIVSADLDRNIEDVNDAFARMLGYTREELTDSQLGWRRRLTPPEYWGADDRAREQLERTGMLHGYEKEYLHKDGSRVPVLIGSAVLDEPGQGREAISCILDLSHLKRAEDALRESEQRFQRLSDSGVIGIFTSGYDGRIIAANDAFLGVIGYSQDDVTSGQLRWDQLTPPEWDAYDAQAMADCRITKVAHPYEKEYFHKDGHRVPILIGGAQVDDTLGVGTCFVVDLSERKRVEAALRQSERRFKTLAESGVIGLLTADLDGRILDANAAFAKMLGYSRDEMAAGQLRWDHLTPPEWGERDAQAIAEIRVSKVLYGYEKEYLHKDGSRVPVLISAAVLTDEPEGAVVCCVLDQTDRKRAEELRIAHIQVEAALRKSDLLLQGLVASDIIGILSGDASGHIVDANDAFLGMVGYTRDELNAGMVQWDHLTPPEWRERAARARDEGLREGAVRAFEKELFHRDGRRISVLIGGVLPEAAINGVAFVLDLSHRKQAEVLREQHAVAEASSRAKTEFLSSMSHELRTPLNAILGFAQLLRRDKKQPLSERHLDRVNQILNGGEHLLRLIEDILDLSRIESGGVSVSIEPLDAYQILEQLMPALDPLAARSQITITLADSPDDLPLVAADRVRLTQILTNFASNAIKYNRAGGSVQLRLAMSGRGHVRLLVSDTGIGIPHEKQGLLFQAFQRAGQENGSIEGTGIGLFIAQRLAQLMLGAVGFRSTLGQGSEFWVDIPIARMQESISSQVPRTSLAKAAAVLRGRRVILQVEDSPTSLAFMQDLISSLFDDVSVLSATSGELGLALARVHKVDAILMDINLPGMSGYDVLRELRNDPKTQDVPVVAVSAAALPHDKQSGQRAGFFAYLTKPVNVDDFIAVLKRIFPSHNDIDLD